MHKETAMQKEVMKAGTLAEAQSILDQLVGEEEEVTDIFYTQQEMIGSLQDLLAIQDRQQQQPIYVSPQAPLPKSKNYLIYIMVGIGILLFTGKLKL